MKIYNPFKKISKLERELKDSLLDLAWNFQMEQKYATTDG